MHEFKIKNLADLKEYESNSRTHSQDQIKQIEKSITSFGFTNAILIDENNGIIAGHGRALAAANLKLEQVPCMVITGLSQHQKAALVIADNKIAENAGWNYDALKSELGFLSDYDFDLSLTGFSLEELDDLLDLEIDAPLTDEDSVPGTPEKPVSVRGDVWVLGNHRLMCGDSTSIDEVSRLLDGQTADMVFTDPPYNVAFNGRSGKHDVIKNDNISDFDFNELIDGVCSVIKILDPKVYYIWCNWKFYGLLQEKLEYKTCIVWAKNVFGMGNGYRHQHEFCLFNGKIDQEIKNESDLWEIKKDHNYVHPTQKPVALSVRAFGNHIKLLNVVDLFGGSGSTLIGAQQTGRKAFVMELDEKYVDVIIKRWQEYTGKKAKHEDGRLFDDIL